MLALDEGDGNVCVVERLNFIDQFTVSEVGRDGGASNGVCLKYLLLEGLDELRVAVVDERFCQFCTFFVVDFALEKGLGDGGGNEGFFEVGSAA